MSRTTLSALTAAGLVAMSLLLMAGRYHVLGQEILVPQGPRTWKVNMKVNGASTAADARLMTVPPLDFDRQHIRLERFASAEMLEKPPTARYPERRQVLWSQRAGVAPGPFAVRYEFFCDIDVRSPSTPMSELAHALYAAPLKGEYLESEALIE